MPDRFNLKDLKLAIVDVETTGASVTGDRIIEIAIQRIERGKVVRTFESLVDPQERIPPFIEALTGITNKDVASAPTFHAIHDEVESFIKGCVFTAHNARFDYGFIRNECSRLGCSFSAPCLCTVRLSRHLYPQHRGHSLDDLIERFGLRCARRHRALDDVRALWAFMRTALKQCGDESFKEAVKALLKMPTLPPQLSAEDLDGLPDGPGVYIFYDAIGQPLYVGKSRSIRSRVLSHFSGDSDSGRHMRLCQAVARIETHLTYGELGALLLESKLIKSLAPLHNRRLRQATNLAVAVQVPGTGGYAAVRIEQWLRGQPLPAGLLGIFRSVRQAKELVLDLANANQLCPQVLGLQPRQGSCIHRQIKQCRGACAGDEPPALFNARLEAAFVSRRLRSWPYPGPVMLEEVNTDGTQGHVFVLNEWRLVKALRYDESGTQVFLSAQDGFDHDTYKILVTHLLRCGDSVKPYKEFDE